MKKQNPRRGNSFVLKNSKLSLADQVEDRGLEPLRNSNTTVVLPCGCVICQECRAAQALHLECPEWHELVANDIDLQAVIKGWAALPDVICKAILGLTAVR